MRTRIAFLLSILVALGAAAPCGRAQPAADKGPERIGIYDSRAIAIAYAGSRFQTLKMRDLTAELKKAKEAGDAREASRLETEGKRWQSALHRQGFGVAPVDDLLAHIATDLPTIQKSAGVTVLLSKWNKAELDKHPQADRIDVTMKLVDAFHPNEPQRQRALEIQKKSPVRVKE